MPTGPQTVHRATNNHSLLRKALLACGAVSSALYVVTDVLGSRRYPGYRYADQEFSELTAQRSPVRRFMIVTNVVPYTLLVTAFALGVRASARPGLATQLTTAGLLGYAGFGIAGGGVFPMETRGNKQTLRNVMHIPSTLLMSLGILVTIGGGSRLLGRRFRYYSYATILVLVAFGLLASLQAGRLAANQPTPWMGIEERVNIYATMLRLALLSTGLLRAQEYSGMNRAHPAR